MPPRDYMDARDTFPLHLQQQVYTALGNKCGKVTVRPAGAPLSLSERKLGEDLAYDLRAAASAYFPLTYYFGVPCASPSSQTATSATTPATPPPQAKG